MLYFELHLEIDIWQSLIITYFYFILTVHNEHINYLKYVIKILRIQKLSGIVKASE